MSTARVLKFEKPEGNRMSEPEFEAYTKLPTWVLDMLLSEDFTKRETNILLAVARQTFGYAKTEDDITISQLARLAHLKRPNASTAFNKLVKTGVLNTRKGRFGFIVSINPTCIETIRPYQNNTPQNDTTVSKQYAEAYQNDTHNIKLPIQKHIYVDANESEIADEQQSDDANAPSSPPVADKKTSAAAANEKRFVAIVEVFNQVFENTDAVRKVSLEAKSVNKKRIQLVPKAWGIAKQRVEAWATAGEIEKATSKHCIEWFQIYFESCAADPFINGTNRSKGHENWKASFEYLLRPEVMEARVLESV